MLQALLLGVIAFIAQSEFALGTSLISRPIVTGLFTGLVMGDVKTGLIMGATLELAFIGSFSVGGAIPPDVVTGGILGVAFAIASAVLKTIPNFVQQGLAVATGIIPALGFAMLARLLLNKTVVPYLFLGFAVAVYTEIPLTGIAILGAILAVITVNMTSGIKLRNTDKNNESEVEEDEDF